MYNLTMSQMNIYMSELSSEGFPINTLHSELCFFEKADEGILKKAVDFVIENSDIFRIRIIHKDGCVLQDFSGEIIPCTVDDVKYRESELIKIINKRRAHVFNLEKSLYNFTIFKKENGQLVLSILLHHIIIDGCGIGILWDEILKAYHQLIEEKPLVFDALPYQASLNARKEMNEENKAFWHNYFKDYDLGGKPFTIKTELTKVSDYKGKIACEDINNYCKKQGITPYTVFTAALFVYLMNIYGSDETAVIIPRMNRELNERKIIGNFVLPVPVRIKKDEDFTALCQQVGREAKIVSAHKKYDYNQLIEDFRKQLGTERAISYYTLNFHPKEVKDKILTKLDVSACGAMRNLITINISNYEGGKFYNINYDYREDVLSETYMSFFHDALVGIIKQGINGTTVSEIQIIPDEEMTYLNNKFKGEAISYQKDDTIVSLFKKAVIKTPNAPAVYSMDKNNSLTFSEIDNLSNKIAGALIKRGAHKGSLIGFLLERNFSLIPTMLGILKAGCGFMPLDINYPKGRIDYIINDSKAKFIISTKTLAEKFKIDFIDVNDLMHEENISLEDGIVYQSNLVNQNNLDYQNDLVQQNDLAYCIYTSGTTGQPKGVMLSHKGIVNITNPNNNPFNKAVCDIGTGIVAIGSICFDISLFEIFVFLLNNKFVALASDNNLADGEAIAEIFNKTGANALHCTPTRLHSYLSGDLFAKILKTQIKIILSAGEVLPTHLAELITDYNIKIYNGYGPTEVTIGATITEAGDHETIGKPIANTAIHILNKKKKPQPFGVTGEIAVTGDGVGLSYIGNEKLTAERFIFINGERGYLTGDMGYFLTDGRLKYIARNDNQIKLRGYRIELSEIEECALKHRDVETCAVVVKEHNNEKVLILYYSGKADAEELKEHLRGFLSYYMVPQAVLRLKVLPSTVSGKIDRQALENLPMSFDREYTPPETKEEKILCEAFSVALSIKQVGVDDNFFEIGGTSLTAVKMLMYANKFDLDVEYSAIFKYPTPRMLADNIGKGKIVNYVTALISSNEREFENINSLLRKNYNSELNQASLKYVLVTGATGFLGSHIVKYLIEDDSIKRIYCLVRQKGKLSPEKRLKTTLYYYFSDISEEQFEEKIHVINGDITDKNLMIPEEVDAVYNCAANVAHFAYGDVLKSVNIDGVENLINFCIEKKATLIHISTISVAGHNLISNNNDYIFTEHDLYKKQIISNEYVYSKFAAEYLILLAKTKGLSAKIMRVGNLQGRMDDGEFQMNLQENAFARNIKAYAAIGRAPFNLKNESVNITPIDETAKAVLLLSRLDDSYTIFHVINPVPVPYERIFSGLMAIGKEIIYVEDMEFKNFVNSLSKDENESIKVEGLLLEKSDIRLQENPVDAEFTTKSLKKLGFEFKTIKQDYVENYLNLLNGLGFFD